MATNQSSPVQDMSDTGDGRKLLEQAMGETATASDLAKNNPAITQYGYRGDPAEVTPISPQDATSGAHGASGTVVFAGFITNEEYNAVLVGQQGLLKYDEMRRSDATVRWSLQVIKLPIRAAEWRIQEASDSPIDKDIADFVAWNLFERINWTSTLREIMTYLDFGFMVGEKIYSIEQYQPNPIKKGDDSDDTIDENVSASPSFPAQKQMVVLRAIENRKQTTIFRWEQGDGSAGVTQVTAQGTFDIPENRLFIITHEREGNNYYGMSLLRSSYRNWYAKDALYKISTVAAERQGVGVIKIKALQKPQESELQKAIEAAENVRSNESANLVEPANFDISFMDMAGHGVVNVAADIEHHNRQIMLNVGAAFMEMGATRSSGSTGGSRSASNDQSKVYELAVEAVANEIEEAVNTMIIRQLVDLNYSNVRRYPRLKHAKIGENDLPSYAKAIADLTTSDIITPDPDLEQAVRERADLPDLPDDIRADYDKRDRAQASTVPQFAPLVAPGTVQPIEPPPDDVKATEFVDTIKRIYADIDGAVNDGA